MIYRILMTILVVVVLLAVYAVKGGDDEASPVAPATSSNPDEARFKGLTIQ